MLWKRSAALLAMLIIVSGCGTSTGGGTGTTSIKVVPCSALEPYPYFPSPLKEADQWGDRHNAVFDRICSDDPIK